MLCDMIILGVLNLYIIYLIYNRPSKIVIYQQHKLLWITNLSHNNELFFILPLSLSLKLVQWFYFCSRSVKTFICERDYEENHLSDHRLMWCILAMSYLSLIFLFQAYNTRPWAFWHETKDSNPSIICSLSWRELDPPLINYHLCRRKVTCNVSSCHVINFFTLSVLASLWPYILS